MPPDTSSAATARPRACPARRVSGSRSLPASASSAPCLPEHLAPGTVAPALARQRHLAGERDLPALSRRLQDAQANLRGRPSPQAIVVGERLVVRPGPV